MQTIEIIIYFVIALIVGALVISFIATVDARETYNSFKSIFFPKQEDFKRVNREDLAMTIYDKWKDCGYGILENNYTIYAYDNLGKEINHSFLFQTYLKFNLCNFLQSESNNCGSVENVVIKNSTEQNIASIHGSTLLNVQCDKNNKKLIIQSLS